jgi:hypothetical protein
MTMPTLVVVLLYVALLFALTLIVRRAYVRRRDWPGPKREDLERVRFPYSPPPERRNRAFDWSGTQASPRQSRWSRLGAHAHHASLAWEIQRKRVRP